MGNYTQKLIKKINYTQTNSCYSRKNSSLSVMYKKV